MENKMNRAISFMICVLLILLCSCNSSKHAYKHRRKPAPCDCPKFNYAPQNGINNENFVRFAASREMVHF